MNIFHYKYKNISKKNYEIYIKILRDARHHGMTPNEKIEATGNMIVLGATVVMLIEAAPAIIAAGGYTINKAIDALNKSGSWIGRSMQNLTNYGGCQLALAGGVTTSASAVSTSAIGSLNVTNSINAFSNFTNAFPKVYNAISNNGYSSNSLKKKQKVQIDALRSGKDVKVKTQKEARELLDNMPELKPETNEGKMPNPTGKTRDGFSQKEGTYKGDLINKQDPMSPVHPKC